MSHTLTPPLKAAKQVQLQLLYHLRHKSFFFVCSGGGGVITSLPQ